MNTAEINFFKAIESNQALLMNRGDGLKEKLQVYVNENLRANCCESEDDFALQLILVLLEKYREGDNKEDVKTLIKGLLDAYWKHHKNYGPFTSPRAKRSLITERRFQELYDTIHSDCEKKSVKNKHQVNVYALLQFCYVCRKSGLFDGIETIIKNNYSHFASNMAETVGASSRRKPGKKKPTRKLLKTLFEQRQQQYNALSHLTQVAEEEVGAKRSRVEDVKEQSPLQKSAKHSVNQTQASSSCERERSASKGKQKSGKRNNNDGDIAERAYNELMSSYRRNQTVSEEKLAYLSNEWKWCYQSLLFQVNGNAELAVKATKGWWLCRSRLLKRFFYLKYSGHTQHDFLTRYFSIYCSNVSLHASDLNSSTGYQILQTMIDVNNRASGLQHLSGVGGMPHNAPVSGQRSSLFSTRQFSGRGNNPPADPSSVQYIRLQQ